MENFEAGDLVTYRLHGDDYGLAHILMIEKMATYSHYHLAVLDAVLEAESGGVDSYGVAFQRSFTVGEEEAAPAAIDHIALTLEAFLESSPAKIDFRDVTDEELMGYRMWLVGAREQLVASGRIHAGGAERDEAEDEDEFDEADEVDDGGDGEDLVDDEDGADGAAELGGVDDAESVEEEIEHLEREEGEESLYDELAPGEQTVVLRPWHRHIFDRPLGDILFELRDELARDGAAREMEDDAAPRLVAYITTFFERKGEAVIDLVNRFVNEGDYAAGHELMAFGDPAADALGACLGDGMDTQIAEDILNVLCDMGSLHAYEHIAAFFEAHYANPADPLYAQAVRGFCYAVMLTGGTPDPLASRLDHLEEIADPELTHDLASAREAVKAAAKSNSEV
jgi:hypothetical protein